MANGLPAEDTQLTVKFVTKLPEQYQVPDAAVAVPAKLSRYGLSQVINGLLGLEPPRPLDFLVAGELVRQPLEKLVTSYGLSAELVLEVEYTLAVLPPKLKDEVPHDDWVSAVAAQSGGSMLTGSYDGVARLCSGTGEDKGSFAAHKGRITSVATLPEAQGAGLALTAGQDGTARLWQLDDSATESSADAATLVAIYRGHKDTVTALSVSPDGARFASASWDGSVHIWRTGAAVVEEAEEAHAAGAASAGAKKKRRGTDTNGATSAAGALEVAASEQLLAGHKQCVSSVCWAGDNTIVTGSWDHSVRLWDAATGTNFETYNHNKAVHCVAMAAGGEGLVAFGGAENALRLWDPRTAKGDDLVLKALTSHTDWISAIAWHPDSQHNVATASHDGSVKLWDTRSAVPLHTISGHTDKVLCVAWTGREQVSSGGADCKLRIHDVRLGLH